MQIALSKDSDVPLRQQLSEQIVFLITTGQLRAGDAMPSVRALGRQSKIHHNTVSEAYQELVRRGWLTRRPGSRLVVGLGRPAASARASRDLDELINYSIGRARSMGYDLQALRLRVRERLLAEPPDHLLVVEEETGLRELLRQEMEQALRWPSQSCSCDEFLQEPGLAIGAQVVAANHVLEAISPLVPSSRPALGLVYSPAAEHTERIRQLQQPSLIAIVSINESVLRTAKSLFAPAIAKRHALQEVLVTGDAVPNLSKSDLVFCDTATLGNVHCRNKVHYPLVSADCLASLSASLH